MTKIKSYGVQLANKIISHLKTQIQAEQQAHSAFFKNHPELHAPEIHIINVGHNNSSLSYITKKMNIAKEIGITCKLHQFGQKQNHPTLLKLSNEFQDISFYPINTHSQTQIHTLISRLNHLPSASGILLQLPLQHLRCNASKLIQNIEHSKDIDCLTTQSKLQLLRLTQPNILPCTPAAVMTILQHWNVDLHGKHIVIVGRSQLVGLPLFYELQRKNATVTLCHSHTKNLQQYIEKAQIIITAVGKAGLITKLPKGSIAIDIGITRDDTGKLRGDILQEAKQTCSLWTPVPGGVGPMTVAMLMSNALALWKLKIKTKML